MSWEELEMPSAASMGSEASRVHSGSGSRPWHSRKPWLGFGFGFGLGLRLGLGSGLGLGLGSQQLRRVLVRWLGLGLGLDLRRCGLSKAG